MSKQILKRFYKLLANKTGTLMIVSLAMMVYQPAEAYLMGGIACKSDMPGVTTPDTRWISTPCYPICFFGSSVGRDNATAFVIHFDHSYKSDKQGCTKTESEDCKEVVKLTGPIRVAVRSNDSRIDPPYLREINLGSLTGQNRLAN